MSAASATQFKGGRAWWLGALLLALALGITGYWMLFSNFALYDDEGYILLSAREYIRVGHLYETVYSQYGPAFYVAVAAWQKVWLGGLDQAAARWLTLGLWLGAAAGCGALVARRRAGSAPALATFAATFLYLYFITDEPFHPGSHIICLLAASLAVAGYFLQRGQYTTAAALLGAAGAWLVLTKINVGVLYMVAVAGWGGLQWRGSSSGRSWPRIVVGVAYVASACALTSALHREAWVQEYIFIFAVGALTLMTVVPCSPIFSRGGLGAFAAAAAGTSVIILAAVWMRGTSLRGLVDGVFLGPLRHPGNYSYPVDWRPGTIALALLSLATLCWYYVLKHRDAARADRLIRGLRLAQIVGLAIGVLALVNFRAVGAIFSYITPLIWTWVVPLDGASVPPGRRSVAGLIGCVLLLQFLHAYPVGGSQESWGTFLFFPLVGLGLMEMEETGGRRTLAAAAGSLFLAACVLKAGWTGFAAGRKYYSQTPLALPGAGGLRLPSGLATGYRIVALNAAAHADTLFSLPGMYSFNLWTDRPPPTEKNTTLWFTLLNASEQRAIQDVLESKPASCIILQESLVQLMQAGKVPIQGPLCDYILREYIPAFRVEGFAFLVRRGRAIAPLGMARLLSSPAGEHGGTELEFSWVSSVAGVAALDIEDLTANRPSQHVPLDATNFAWQEIDGAGRTRSLESHGVVGVPATRLIHSVIRLAVPRESLSAETTLLRLRSSTGESIAEIRINP